MGVRNARLQIIKPLHEECAGLTPLKLDAPAKVRALIVKNNNRFTVGDDRRRECRLGVRFAEYLAS
jgi:hypothetical protein